LIQLAIYARASVAFLVRMVQRLWLPVLDLLIMIGGFSGIAWYWV